MTERLILVVEDDPQWQKLFDELVSDAGFSAIVTATAKDAVAALSKEDFVLAVVDISLAFKDHQHRGGVAVLQEILKLPANRRVIFSVSG